MFSTPFLIPGFFAVGKMKEACKATASYLLFYPNDETMMSNIKYYKKLPKVEEDFFTPREVIPFSFFLLKESTFWFMQEALEYFRRDTYEQKLLSYISENFRFSEDERDMEKPSVELLDPKSVSYYYSHEKLDLCICDNSIPWVFMITFHTTH